MQQWNQSLIKAWACPFRGQWLLAHGKQASSELTTRIGSAFHVFAARYVEHCKEHTLSTDLAAVGALVDTAAQTAGLDAGERADLGFLASMFSESYIVPDHPLLCEVTLTAWGCVLFGTPDLIEFPSADEIIITDRKTWRRLRGDAEIKAGIQLPFYAGLALESYPQWTHARLRVDQVRYGKITEWVMTRAEVEAEQVRILALVDGLQRAVVDGDHEPLPGSQCDWCECTAECPLVARGEVKVLDADSARVAAETLYVTERRGTQLRDALKGYVDRHGPVVVGDVTLDYQRTNHMEYDTVDVLRWFAQHNAPAKALLPFLGVNQTAIKRMAKAFGLAPAARQEALALGERVVRTQFMFGDAEDNEGDGV